MPCARFWPARARAAAGVGGGDESPSTQSIQNPPMEIKMKKHARSTVIRSALR